ncbi:MAG: PRC-barrel domain-containing protein [Methanomassiliicoccales archaeon]|nr:MAG: PRC-barrel domain-containing protein [Methanomassiliicoccales archaeon]
MLEEASEIIGLEVYTPAGLHLGTVNNLVIDLENKRIDGLFIDETNPLLVEDSKAVNVPYRWIQAIGDVVILKYFPKRVTSAKKAAPPPKAAAPRPE